MFSASRFALLMHQSRLPFIIGTDYAGTISALGSSVEGFQVGDRVYGFTLAAGAAAEYVLLSPSPNFMKFSIFKIPEHASFEDMAAMPSSAYTAICALQMADKMMEKEGGLKGKTVLVPAGLGGIGSFALQLLKPVFGAGRVITTVSNGKVAKVEKLLGEGLVDQIIDYTTADVVTELGGRTVDFVFDTAKVMFAYLPLVKEGGVMLTLFGKTRENMKHDWPTLPFWLDWLVGLVDWFMQWRAGRWGVRFASVFTQFGEDNAGLIDKWLGDGTLKAVLGGTVAIEDIEDVKRMYDIVGSGKGAVGKYVVVVI
jgi:NADPH:quinone reductase-like Zn-dependent oxidoreductase